MPRERNGAHDELRDKVRTHLLKYGPMALSDLAEAVKPKAMTMGAFRGALVVGQRAGLLTTAGHAAGARWSAVGGANESRGAKFELPAVDGVVSKRAAARKPASKAHALAAPALIPAPPEGVDAELAGPLLAKREGHVRAIAKIDALLISLADL